MAINYKDILTEGVSLPLAIEAVLPAGAPRISSVMTAIANALPNLPDFPAPIPDLPSFQATVPPGLTFIPITIEWD
jgi:hypothetical protein